MPSLLPDNFYFQWPWALLLLLLLPILVVWYRRHQKRQWQNALRFSYTATVEKLSRETSAVKRLFSPVLQFYVLLLLILSLSRPTVVTQIPTHAVEMMLVMDISLSMMAEDIAPTRLEAARDAGVRFIKSLPRDVRVGLEFFAGNAYVVSPPGKSRGTLLGKLKQLKLSDLQLRTEIGTALQLALETLEMTPDAAEETGPNGSENQDLQDSGEGPAPKIPSVPESLPPQRVIILLTDGDSNEGYPWQTAARNAKDQNVLIYTVGVGKLAETTILYQNQELPVFFNDGTLKQIAEITGGKYFRAFRSEDFKTIYQEVQDRAMVYEERPEDKGYLFSLAAFLLLIGLFVSRMTWLRHLP